MKISSFLFALTATALLVYLAKNKQVPRPKMGGDSKKINLKKPLAEIAVELPEKNS